MDSQENANNANKFFEALEEKKTINLSLTAKIEGGTQWFYSDSLPFTFGFDGNQSIKFDKYFLYAELDRETEKFGIILQTSNGFLKVYKIGEIVNGTDPLSDLDVLIGQIGNGNSVNFTFSYDPEPEESQNPNGSIEGLNSLILIFPIICWLLCICCCLFAIRS